MSEKAERDPVMNLVKRLRKTTPQLVDLILTGIGLLFISIGAALVYGPAGFISAGVGLFYLGALHR